MPADRHWTAAVLAGAMALLSAGAAAQDDPDLPGEAFLEFLGSWEDADGNWLDPLTFDSPGAGNAETASRDAGDDRDDSAREGSSHTSDEDETDKRRTDDEAEVHDAEVASDEDEIDDSAAQAETAEHDSA